MTQNRVKNGIYFCSGISDTAPMQTEHKPFQESDFEVHIVGYKGTNLDEVPKPFFTNRVDESTQGFACIATAETDNLPDAHRYFELASEWSEKQLTVQPKFGVHTKLEAVKKQVWVDKPDLVSLPAKRKKKFNMAESALVSAWDVHLDGFFDEQFKKALHKDGYIILDYLSSNGEEMATLTMHFLRPEECVEEFNRIVTEAQKSGGFVGNIYYEDPLAFAVYGPTIPRPVVSAS